MKVVTEERYTFEFNDKTWTVYNKEDADYLDKQLKDAKRYRWAKENLLICKLYNGDPEEWDDAMIDAAIEKVAV